MAVAAFDIGGTHFRSALVWHGDSAAPIVENFRTAPTDTYLTRAVATQAQLRQALVTRIVETVDELSSTVHVASAGISLGAAIDARTGLVVSSGPILGARSEPFDLRSLLSDARPDVSWVVVNDITAAAWHYASSAAAATLRRIGVMVIGSGVGLRTIVPSSMHVPVGAMHGLQGEIGHLPIVFHVAGLELELTCDCGGPRHLNAYASGNGIAKVWRAVRPPDEPHTFPDALRAGAPSAMDVLDAVARALAEAVAWVLTVDPEIERLYLVGGVVRGAGPLLTQCIVSRLENGGMYQVMERRRDFFAETLRFVLDNDHCELLGASRLAVGGDR